MRTLYDLPAPAKINLFLHHWPPRRRYHLLQSVFLLLDWCDTLHIEARPHHSAIGRRRHSNHRHPAAQRRSDRARSAHCGDHGLPPGATFSLDKRLPASGPGCGSSDAATTLLALNRLWGLGLSRSELQTHRPEAGC